MKQYKYKINGADYDVVIESIRGSQARVAVNGIPFEVEMQGSQLDEANLPDAAPCRRRRSRCPRRRARTRSRSRQTRRKSRRRHSAQGAPPRCHHQSARRRGRKRQERPNRARARGHEDGKQHRSRARRHRDRRLRETRRQRARRRRARHHRLSSFCQISPAKGPKNDPIEAPNAKKTRFCLALQSVCRTFAPLK